VARLDQREGIGPGKGYLVMRGLLFAAPLAVMAICGASSALADNVNYINIKNFKARLERVEYAVGNSTDCDVNHVYRGIEPIPGGGVFKLKITAPHPRYCCLRLVGGNTNPNWVREPLAGGRDYELAIR
jgi:hypothetical protein